MYMVGTSVTADHRQGMVRIAKDEERLLHFQWLDFTTKAVEDDLIIFPDEALFKRIKSKDGRVYLLKFYADDRKLFFWMQDKREEHDEIICTTVNFHLNRPLDTEVARGKAPATDEMEPSEESDSSSSSDDDFSIDEDLRDEFSAIPVKSSSTAAMKLNEPHGIASGFKPKGLVLGDIFRHDLVMPLIGKFQLMEKLVPYLPEGQRSPSDLLETLHCSIFREQVDSFSNVLQTGQLDLSQFGIDPINYKLTVLSFLEALDDSVSKVLKKSKKKQKDSNKGKKSLVKEAEDPSKEAFEKSGSKVSKKTKQKDKQSKSQGRGKKPMDGSKEAPEDSGNKVSKKSKHNMSSGSQTRGKDSKDKSQ